MAADVWSVDVLERAAPRRPSPATSGTCSHPDGGARAPYVTQRCGPPGPVVAVSDWMRAVPDQIAPWVAQDWTSLGTDGFGLSDTRPALRRHFGVDAQSIVVAALAQLARRGDVAWDVVRKAHASTSSTTSTPPRRPRRRRNLTPYLRI